MSTCGSRINCTSFSPYPMFNHAEDLAEIEEMVREAIAAIPTNQPNLISPAPASCVQIFVRQPSRDAEILGDFVFAASPIEFYRMMRGSEVLGQHVDVNSLRGIFPLSQPDEALSLAYSLLEEVQTPRCRRCGQPYGPDLDGSPGVLQHRLDDGSDEVNYDQDEDHAPVPEEEE